MNVFQTESADAKTLEESQWKIAPPNFPMLTVSSPEISVELIEVVRQEGLPSDVNLVLPASGRAIDMPTHRALLRESLLKHGDIWRTLARE